MRPISHYVLHAAQEVTGVLFAPITALAATCAEVPMRLRIARANARARETMDAQLSETERIVARYALLLAAIAASEEAFKRTNFASPADARTGLVALKSAQARLVERYSADLKARRENPPMEAGR